MSTNELKAKPNRRRTLILAAVTLFFACGICGVISTLIPDSDTPSAELAEEATGDSRAEAGAADESAAELPAPTEEPPTEVPTDTPVPTAAPTAEPTATLSPDQALHAAVADALGTSNRDVDRLVRVEDDNGRIEVDWAINDNLTENLTQGGAQLDATDILRAVAESGYDYEFILMRGTFPLIDQLGNVEESKVVELFFSRELVDQINFDNFDHRNVYDIADAAEIHPTFVRQ